MKYTFLFFIAVGLLFSACKKKASAVGCYTCVTTLSQHTSVASADTIKPQTSTGTLCNYNSGEIAFYIKTHSVTDTVFNSGGVVNTQSRAITCTAQ